MFKNCQLPGSFLFFYLIISTVLITRIKLHSYIIFSYHTGIDNNLDFLVLNASIC